MRKNTVAVYEAWRQGKAKAGRSISTDGRTIFSYATPIVEITDPGFPDSKAFTVALNERAYSSTTSRQQSDLRFMLVRDGYLTPRTLPKGPTHEELFR